ncbi:MULTISPECIES: proton-conducting transporter membrane subunit [Aphanothece]|uniref:proton-conducting transporter transmembrane domain-containing protein n=1 Tax=Aphanothece TaxID=1121 RepID=UPI0039855F59
MTLIVAWLLLPFLGAFLAALLPSTARPLALGATLATLAMGLVLLRATCPWSLELTGPLGVLLQADAHAAPFLLLNALVVLAVLLDTWGRAVPGPFLLLVMVLLGGLNSAFLAVDLVSLYVALEVVGVTAFLLILQKREPQQLWIALRYLLVGNSVMTLYLVGVALLYLRTGSFRIVALADPALGSQGQAVVLALVLVGLLTKSGVFLSGLWLPRTHAEAPAEVSALLSGVVVAGGLCPLLRLAGLVPSLRSVLLVIGLASALLGVCYALADRDLKRLLAWSTLSQTGLVLISPASGAFYALAHGVAKAALFLVAARVPSRDLSQWSQQPLPMALAAPLLLGSLSIAGAPLLFGFWTKDQLGEAVASLGSPPAELALLVAMVGTAAVYTRLCWRPLAWDWRDPSIGALLLALLLLAAGLLLPGRLPAASAVVKSVGVLAFGVAIQAGCRLLALGWARWRSAPRLPGLPNLERLQDLLGCMALVGVAVWLTLLPLEAPWLG